MVTPQERPTSTSAVTEQAVGIVMALGRLRPDQARTVLAEVSQRTNITLRRIAELVTAWAACGELNLGIRIALEESIRSRPRPPRPPRSTAG
ncbi:ANTAR domain-containing protein [Streptomyces sp. NPDC058751]|uniref:ANTAR domain-containing protein n=1 Tax=Streptomyces sp. NPDC058751 TaxID=3346623 RepID=UPI00367B104A